MGVRRLELESGRGVGGFLRLARGLGLRHEVGDVAVDLAEQLALLGVACLHVGLHGLDLGLLGLGDGTSRDGLGLLLRELLARSRELGEEVLVALAGDVGVLLASREILRARGVELRDATTLGAATHVDVGGACGDGGADLSGLRLRGRNAGVGLGDRGVRGVERDLRAVDLLVERVELAAVVGDLGLECGCFRALVVDLGGVGRTQKGYAQGRDRQRRERQGEQAQCPAVPPLFQQHAPQSATNPYPSNGRYGRKPMTLANPIGLRQGGQRATCA